MFYMFLIHQAEKLLLLLLDEPVVCPDIFINVGVGVKMVVFKPYRKLFDDLFDKLYVDGINQVEDNLPVFTVAVEV